jgi:hypothetical protein
VHARGNETNKHRRRSAQQRAHEYVGRVVHADEDATHARAAAASSTGSARRPRRNSMTAAIANAAVA